MTLHLQSEEGAQSSPHSYLRIPGGVSYRRSNIGRSLSKFIRKSNRKFTSGKFSGLCDVLHRCDFFVGSQKYRK